MDSGTRDALAVGSFIFCGASAIGTLYCGVIMSLDRRDRLRGGRTEVKETPQPSRLITIAVALFTLCLTFLGFGFYLTLWDKHPRTWFAILAAILITIGMSLVVFIKSKAWHSQQGKARSKSGIPKIEDDPDVNALNIRITNDFEKTGLQDCFLYLHNRLLIDRKARTPLPSFQVMRLTSNHHDIPYLVERRYQLVEYTNPTQPFFRTYGGTVDLPCMGLWRLDLELVWYGGQPYHFSKCFMWEGGRSPYFVECPSSNAPVEELGTNEQTSDDPRVYIKIEEQKVGPVKADVRTVFVAYNEGGIEARNVRIEFPLSVDTVTFAPVDVIRAKDKAEMIPEIMGERWPGNKSNIFISLKKQIQAREASTGKWQEDNEFNFTLTYEGYNLSRRFECPATLLFRSLHQSLKSIDMLKDGAKSIVEIKHGDCKITVSDKGRGRNV